MKLKLKRLSSLPNQFGNYCYEIISGSTKGMSGVKEQDGRKLLWSFSRIGSLSAPTTVEADTRKERGGERTFLNLIDTTTDRIGEIAYLANVAKRAGLGQGNTALDTAAASALFSSLNTQSTAQRQEVQTPVEEGNPAGGASLNEPEETEEEIEAREIEEAKAAAKAARLAKAKAKAPATTEE